MAYTFKDYQNQLDERSSHDIDSAGWRLAQQNIETIIGELLAQGSKEIAYEIVDEIYSLMECEENTPYFNETADMKSELVENIKKDIQLLRDNGFEDMIDDEIEEWEETRR